MGPQICQAADCEGEQLDAYTCSGIETMAKDSTAKSPAVRIFLIVMIT